MVKFLRWHKVADLNFKKTPIYESKKLLGNKLKPNRFSAVDHFQRMVPRISDSVINKIKGQGQMKQRFSKIHKE